jgi:hypothetical protein
VTAYEEAVPLWLRPGRGRLVLGLRGGYTQGLSSLGSTRGGVELSFPLRLGGIDLAVGALAMYGQASQSAVSPNPSANPSVPNTTTQIDATFIPMTLRLTGELFGNRWFGFYAGLGAVGAWSTFNSPLLTAAPSTIGFGGSAVAGASLLVGPGQLFVEVTGAITPVRVLAGAGTPLYNFALDVGGTSFEAGYRMAVLR